MIREQELEVERRNVAERIHRSLGVRNGWIGERAHHVHDGVGVPQVTELLRD